MTDAPDVVANAKDRLRLGAALALRAVASLDTTARSAARGLWSRTTLPSRTDLQSLRTSITTLTRAIRDLDRS